MNWYVDKISEMMTDAHHAMLRQIYEPTYVNIPPDNARRQTCVMPDGEIRQYLHNVYFSSKSGGLFWKEYSCPRCLGASSRNPETGRYVTTKDMNDATYALYSDIGPEDTEYKAVKISDFEYIDMMQPVYYAPKKRWLATLSASGEAEHYHPAIAISDDDALTWKVIDLPSVPEQTPIFPDKGYRWKNDGSEPSVIEMPDGRLMLICRTSLNELWAFYSEDGGDTWSDPCPTPFHATLTTPTLLRLSDGRVIVLWNNTQPMPELNHRNTHNIYPHQEVGLAEDVFTNRDVCHAAITSDGVHWEGFREIKLNTVRNASDYRYCGGDFGDKSVQQFEALELPENRVLVVFGQNVSSRRTVIFSIDWLLEKGRKEDLEDGLQYLSTFLYRKSVLGSNWGRKINGKQMNGHCSYNRADGAVPVPKPGTPDREVLNIGRYHDERLVNELQGAVWNFPNMKRGEVRVRLYIHSAGLRFTFNNVWVNPSDPWAYLNAPFTFTIVSRDVDPQQWRDILVRFDTERKLARVYWRHVGPEGVITDDMKDEEWKYLFTVPYRADAPMGISYLHMQTLAEGPDYGTDIYDMEARVLDDEQDV